MSESRHFVHSCVSTSSGLQAASNPEFLTSTNEKILANAEGMKPETSYFIDRGCEQSVPFKLVEVDLNTNHLVIPFMSSHSGCPQSNVQTTTGLATTAYFPLIPISSLVLPVTDSKSETCLDASKALEPSQQLVTVSNGLQYNDVSYFVQTASSSQSICRPTSSFCSGDSQPELDSRMQNSPPTVPSELCTPPVGSAFVRGWKRKMSKNCSSMTAEPGTCLNPHIESSYHPYHPNHFWCPVCRISYASSSCPTHPFVEEKDSPVTTFARQSLPQCMQLSENGGSYHVVLNKRQAALTRFGPVIAPTVCESELQAHAEWQSDCPFRLDDLEPDGVSHRIRYLKFGNEDLCNWMMFVRRVDIPFSESRSSSELSPNAIAYQQGAEGIFFLTTRPIRCGEELIVAFAPPYAIHCGLCSRSGDEIDSSNDQSAQKAVHGPSNLLLPIRPDEIHCFRCSITFNSEDAFRIHCLGHPDELAQRGFVSSYSEAEPAAKSDANTTDRLRESFIEVCKPNVKEDSHPCECPIRRTYFQSTLHCSLCAAEVIGLSQLVHHTNLEHSVAHPRIFGPSESPNISNIESEGSSGEIFNSDGVLFAANQLYDANIEADNPSLSTGEEVFVVDLSHVSQNLLDVSLWAYGCGQCGQRFPNMLALEQHKESDHINENLSKSMQLRPGSSTSSVGELAAVEDSGDNGLSFLPEQKLADECVEGKIVGDTVGCESDASAAKSTSLGGNRLRQELSRNVPNRTQFQCPTCQMEVRTRSALAVHMRSHNYESTLRIPSVVVCSSSQLGGSSGTVEEGPQTLSRIRPRLRLSSNTGFFTCCVCGESQKNQLTWRMHSLKHRRSSDRRFPCPVCSASSDRAYATFDQLQRHMRHVHANQIFPCPYCPSTFGRRKNLNNHLTRHTGRRDFVCPYENCQKSYSRKDKLHTHMRTHS